MVHNGHMHVHICSLPLGATESQCTGSRQHSLPSPAFLRVCLLPGGFWPGVLWSLLVDTALSLTQCNSLPVLTNGPALDVDLHRPSYPAGRKAVSDVDLHRPSYPAGRKAVSNAQHDT